MAAAAAASAALTVKQARTPPQYTVTVGLLVSEGPMRAREELGVGALRTRVNELTFTRARLGELIKRHPAEFPGAARDPDAAYEGIRERIKVEIVGNDIIDEHSDNDPPRSARITLGFTASNPKAAWQITHALADLLIDSELARRRAAMLREQAGAESAVESAEARSDDTSASDMRSEADHLRETAARAATAHFGLRAAEEQQTLRIELTDPGQVPKPAGRAALIVDAFVTFGLALLAAFLLAGAFDPRVIDAGDLAGVGVPLLGRLPRLPAAPAWTPVPPRNAPDASPAPSDDPGARV